MSSPVYNMKGLGHLLELYGDSIQQHGNGKHSNTQKTIDDAMNAIESAQKRLYSARVRKSQFGGADLYSNHPDVLALETKRQELLKQERSLETYLKQVKQQSFELNRSITNTKARLFKESEDERKKEQQAILAKKLSNIGNAIASGAQNVGNSVTSGVQKTSAGIKSVGNAIKSGVQKTSAGIKSVGTLVSKGVTESAKSVGNAVASGAQNVGNSMASSSLKTSAGIKSVGSVAAMGVKTGAQKLSDGIKSIFTFGKKSSTGIKSIGSDIKKGLQATSKNIANSIDDQRLKSLENKKEQIEYNKEARNLPNTLPRRDAIIPKNLNFKGQAPLPSIPTTPKILSRKDSKLD